MTFKKIGKLFWIVVILYGVTTNIFGDEIDNPCGGPSALLNIVDRPTVGDSPCVVPSKKAVFEFGYQYAQLTHAAGHEQNFPEAAFRLGMPANNELVILPPNYVHQSMMPSTGFGTTTIGVKHEIGYTKKWITTVESLFTLPGGSAAFGSKSLGVAINGIAGYTINPQFNVTFMLGGTTETQSSLDGGQRFESVNPDVVLTYALNPKVNFYGEVYGQSQTGPNEGSGFNFDGGIICLPLSSLALDLEYGQRISGNLGGFEHYVGTGMTVAFI